MHRTDVMRLAARWGLVATLLSVVVEPRAVAAQSTAGGGRGASVEAGGIAVTEPLVRTKCGTCHTVDERGQLQRLSWARSTPEGWQLVVQRMLREHDLALTPPEARTIVKYFSTRHGLAPEEAKPVMYHVERRVHDEESELEPALYATCGRCHEAARALSWRRTADGWRQYVDAHAARYKFKVDAAATTALVKRTPFNTPEWTAWSGRTQAPPFTGRWLATAHVQGRGTFVGAVDMEAVNGGEELVTRVRLRSVNDAAVVIARTGRSVVYGGTAWRGRSQGTRAQATAPDDLLNEAREVMWVSPDGSRVEGRWFWGQYEELGFDVVLQRASDDPTLLVVDPPSLRSGVTGVRLRLLGDRLPESVAAGDINAGAGVTVRRVISSAPGEVVAEVDVAPTAASGSRSISLRTPTRTLALERGVAVYDRVDYLKVLPESSLASYGARAAAPGSPGAAAAGGSIDYAPGFQQFEAIGYHRGADGLAQTPDDIALGPVPVTWSMELFYETDTSKHDRVGTIGASGFFTPAAVSLGSHTDVWIVATAKTDTGADSRPLVAKGYLVVTIPTYTFEGRTFVRELGRWIEEGSSAR